MNGPSIIATVGLERGQFRSEKERLDADLKTTGATAKETAASIAVLERELARGTGTDAQRQRLSALKGEYRDTMKELKLMESQTRALNAALGNGGGGGHGSGGNQGQLAHSSRAMLDMMMSGQSPLRAAQMEAPRVVQAMGGGLGTMAGMGAGLAVANKAVEGITEAIAKSRELELALHQALKPLTTDAHFAGADAIKAKIEELQKVSEEARPAQSERFWTSISQGFSNFGQAAGDVVQSATTRIGNLLSGNFRKVYQQNWSGPQDQRFSEATDADSARQKLAGDLTQKQKELNDLKERGFAHGEESVRQAREELELKEKLGAISRDPIFAGNTNARNQAMQNARDEFAERDREAKRREESETRAVALEEKIVAIKKEGLDVENLTAKARLEAAQKALDAPNAPKSGLQHDKNQEAVDAAALAVRDTAAQTAEKHSEIEEAKRLAGIDGPEPVLRRRQLESDKGLLEGRLNKGSGTYEHDDLKREGVEKDLDEKDKALRALDRDDKEREFSRRREQVDAEVRNGMRGAQRARPGSQASLDAIDDKLAINAEESAYNAPGAGNRGFVDPQVASRLTAEATELKRQKQGIQDAEEKTLREAKSHTHEMELQSKGQTLAAQEAKTRSEYEEKIAAALKVGNTELAGQLQKQQALDLLKPQIDEELKTPEERGKEQTKQRARAEAAYRVQNRQDRHREAVDANDENHATFGKFFHGKDGIPSLLKQPDGGIPDLLKRPDPAPDNPAASANVHVPISSVLPDLRGMATADPQTHQASGAGHQASGAGGDSAAICAKLDQVIAAIHDIDLTNQ